MELNLVDENTAVVNNKEYTAVAVLSAYCCDGCSFVDTDIGVCNIDNSTFCGENVRDDARNIIWVKKDSTPQSVGVSKKRPHADLIKAWADGAEIEFFSTATFGWHHTDCPSWDEDIQFRIVKRDIVHRIHITPNGEISTTSPANIQVTFDAQTGQIKSVNIL